MLSKIKLKNVLIVSFFILGFFGQPMQAQADPEPSHQPLHQGQSKMGRHPADGQPMQAQAAPEQEIRNINKVDPSPQKKGPAHSPQPVDQGKLKGSQRPEGGRPALRKGAGNHVYMNHNFDQDLHANLNYISNAYVNPVVIDIPSGFVTVNVDGQTYYYNGNTGVVYQEVAQEFVPVPAPVGAVVDAIPATCSIDDINGINYYICTGVYYTWTSDGYRVVKTSVPADQEEAVAVSSAPSGGSQESFTINIPDNKGGYVPVTLTRSGSGFVGPQGEFYSEFPAVSLLGVMYGK